MFRLGLALMTGLSFVALAFTPAHAQSIATENFMIPASDPGIKLFVRNKHLKGKTKFAADKVVLFVHGATYPSETVFDVDLPGGSWADYAARRGYDVYMVDVRGYGGSTRPPSMDAPPDQNPAFATTAEGVKDVGSAVDFILKRRGVAKLNLVGWSWGTTLMGGYTAANNAKVNKLVMYATLWNLKAPPPFSGTGAWRKAAREDVRARGLRGIPKDKVEEISPTAWFDKWWQVALATDPVGAKQNPPYIRAPNGVLKDVVDFWGAGKQTYKPEDIRVPTLLIQAEWDQDTPLFMGQEVFSKLVNTPYKRYEVINGGTHTVAIEKNRMHLIRQVQNFLEE